MVDKRAINYYIKNLPFEVRQEIFKRLDYINPIMVERLLEKEKGYPSFKRAGYTDRSISILLEQCSARFEAVNELMIENERYPLFKNSKDTYASSLEYVDLLKEKTLEELIEQFGCDWESYVPKVYKKKEGDKVK